MYSHRCNSVEIHKNAMAQEFAEPFPVCGHGEAMWLGDARKCCFLNMDNSTPRGRVMINYNIIPSFLQSLGCKAQREQLEVFGFDALKACPIACLVKR
jgi:hypothetical protein